MNETLQLAQEYLEMGWSIIPISRETKVPLVKWKEFQDRIAEPEEIEEWWTKWPDADIGVVTGSISNLVAVDCDNDAAIKAVADAGVFSMVQQTTKRGRHYLFSHPGYKVKSTTNWNGMDNVDVRGDGGYIKVAPSKNYEWDLPIGVPYSDIPFELPEWRCEGAANRDSVEQELVLDYEVPISREPIPDQVPKGQRNQTMTRICGAIINDNPDKWGVEIAKLVWEENKRRCNPPLSKTEIVTLTKSIMRLHMQNNPDEFGEETNRIQPVPSHTPVRLVKASDIKPEPINWLWEGYLAAGKLHLLGGAPGTGKTTVALDLAARISVGGKWPDGTSVEPARVFIWSGEDSPKDTLVPRLMAAGADLNNVEFIRGVEEGGEINSFDPAHHFKDLKRQLEGQDTVGLIIVDPIVSAVSGDSHKNAEVRRCLQPLCDIGESLGCAVLGITHFTKGTAGTNPVERITGSLAFGALARVVLVAAKKSSSELSERIFMRAKSNIGPDGGGFTYLLEQLELEAVSGVITSEVVWQDCIDDDAFSVLCRAESPPDDEARSALDDAKDFLHSALITGEKPAKDIYSEAKENGISEASIKRAKKLLSIKVRRAGGKNAKWLWGLPH